MDDSKIIRLNFQGTIKETRWENLQKIPYFAAMFSGNFTENADKEIFIDRNGDTFQRILDNIINNDWSYIPHHMINEINFYGFDINQFIDSSSAILPMDISTYGMPFIDNSDLRQYDNGIKKLILKSNSAGTMVTKNEYQFPAEEIRTIAEFLVTDGRVTIYRNWDALETPIYLEIAFPPLPKDYYWKSRVGLDIIKSISISWKRDDPNCAVSLDHGYLNLEYLTAGEYKDLYTIFEYDETNINAMKDVYKVSRMGLHTRMPIHLLSYQQSNTLLLIAASFNEFEIKIDLQNFKDFMLPGVPSPIISLNELLMYPINPPMVYAKMHEIIYSTSGAKRKIISATAVPIVEVIKISGTEIRLPDAVYVQDMFIITGNEDNIARVDIGTDVINTAKLKYAIHLKKNLTRFPGIYYHSFVNKNRELITMEDYAIISRQGSFSLPIDSLIKIHLVNQSGPQPVTYIRIVNNLCYAAGCVTKKMII